MSPDDTIYALSTVPGRSAIAVVRVSGSRAHDSILTLTGSSDLPPARMLVKRRLVDVSGETIDEAMLVRFDGPGSYTGENSVEYHIHGGVSVASGQRRQGILQACTARFFSLFEQQTYIAIIALHNLKHI